MIDLPVTLTSNGHIQLPGYGSFLCLGYTKNRGVYRLCIDVESEWESLTIRAFWHLPDGKDPVSSLVKDSSVAVPASVTAQPGNGCITFEGSDGTRTVTSADLRYRVGANSGIEDGTAPEPSASSWQQFVDAVKESAEIATKSANASASSATAASKSASVANKNARDANASATEATRQAKLAAQSAEGKGYMYLEDHDNGGTLSLMIADSITDEITLRDDGAGVLEVVYT